MGTFSRLRYVIAANVNALLEKAEDPEKLLRALIREMEDASEEARMACADLLAEQQRLQRQEARLTDDIREWRHRAENAVTQDRDDLARAALKACAELEEQHRAVIDEQKRVADRVVQMEQDMMTLKTKLAEAKTRLKGMQAETRAGATAARTAAERTQDLRIEVDEIELDEAVYVPIRNYEHIAAHNKSVSGYWLNAANYLMIDEVEIAE